jgi:hypothetical protein
MASVSGGRARVESERRQLSPHSGNVLATVSSIESLSARNSDILLLLRYLTVGEFVEVVIRKVF